MNLRAFYLPSDISPDLWVIELNNRGVEPSALKKIPYVDVRMLRDDDRPVDIGSKPRSKVQLEWKPLPAKFNLDNIMRSPSSTETPESEQDEDDYVSEEEERLESVSPTPTQKSGSEASPPRCQLTDVPTFLESILT